ncbi:DUF2267 domain-containing protein [Streptomyces sp. RB6PN25]|uniref:DUF2267 domain-containing protein n=1 Tax=Streptomyces humicola TaxID=2953240 RepID=A0ABT1Q3P0_9ACTN|nr:DUF2267 domain-containing protein [Streptomyces humicola]MCQ4083965.1 DUF2267 domain-containing protein [Streptomyces humicola]
MRWSDLVGQVRERGQYTTTRKAERIIRIVLSALGGQLTGTERIMLSRRLPTEAAGLLLGQKAAVRPLTAAQFVDSVAAGVDGIDGIENTTPAIARWDAGSVLSVVAELAGDELVDRMVRRLPPGYALLFGRAQLSTTVPAEHLSAQADPA